jgi:LacI family transcriptional regulator
MGPVRSRPTITDIAELCQVTPATVSRVLNRKKEVSTSAAVREKILATAHRLGYVPDLAARNLNRKQTHIIGIFASPKTHVAEGTYELYLEGIEEVLHASEYDAFFDLSARREHAVPFWRFDGAILLQSPPAELVAELDRRRVPYVCINERAGTPVAQVLADDVKGARLAVEHLHQLGHRRIAYGNARATYLTHYSVAERYETVVEAARKHRMALAAGHDVPFSSAEEFLRESVVKAGATAVVTYDHRIAVALVGAAYGMDLRIPRDFSLICFNDLFPVSLMPPPLTVITVPGQEMGRLGADLLLNSLGSEGGGGSGGGGAAKEIKEIRVPEHLVVRESTAAPPGR